MKYHKLLLIITIAVSGLSCSKKELDQTPSGRLEVSDIFEDPALTRSYLNSIYTNLPSYSNSYFWLSMLAPKSDEAADSDFPPENLSSAQWNAGNLTPNLNPLYPDDVSGSQKNGYWERNWKSIRLANVFLANIDKVPLGSAAVGGSKAMNEAERNMLKGEAMLLRAYNLFELMKFYGAMPIVTNELTAAFDYTTLKRTTYDENAQFIARQCDTALTLIKVMRRPGNEFGRASGAFALALKSRVLLYNASALNNPENSREKWDQAANAAADVLKLVNLGHYALYNDYYNMFLRQDQGTNDDAFKEIIYQIPRNGGLYFNLANAIPFAQGVKSGTLPSQELVDSYPMANGQLPIAGYSDANHLIPTINPLSGYSDTDPYANRDSRLTSSIFYNGSVWAGPTAPRPHVVETFIGGTDELRNNRNYTRTGYYLKKWINPLAGNGVAGSAIDANVFFPVFRLAEFYLNYAEALNESSGATIDVYNAINALRDRAKTGHVPTGLLKDEMRKVIRNERRIELAFEEHRFFDVRRWKILSETDKLVTGMRITKLSPSSFSYQRFVVENRAAYHDKFLMFPININELSKIPGVVQTKGW